MRRVAFVLLASTALLTLPTGLRAQRRSGGGHTRGGRGGIPCGRSYISADKVCHVGTPAAPAPAPAGVDGAGTPPAGGRSADVRPASDHGALASVPPTIQDTRRAAAAALWLRLAPSETADEVAAVPRGAVLDVSSCTVAEGAWCLASYNGHTGFLSRRLLAAADVPAFAAAELTAPVPASAPRRAQRRVAGSRSTDGALGASGGGHAGYYVGPRGGCYTYSASGRKRYVDHSYCR